MKEEEDNRTIIEEYRNHKIVVDEYGKFCSLDDEIPRGELRTVRYYIDVYEGWKAAEPVKMIRAEYPSSRSLRQDGCASNSRPADTRILGTCLTRASGIRSQEKS